MNIKHNIPLIVGLALPILLILGIVAAIYLPSFFVKPSVNFVYAIGNYPRYCEALEEDRYTQHMYAIKEGQLTETTQTVAGGCYPGESTAPQFYLYDLATDTSKELSLPDLKNLTLNPNQASPDGFKVTYGREGGAIIPFIFFTETDYNSVFISGNNISRRLKVEGGNNRSPYGQYTFNFVGWVVE